MDLLLFRKTIPSYARYLRTIYEISQSGRTTGSILLLKMAHIIRVIHFIVFYYGDLSIYTRTILMDYYCIYCNLGVEFNFNCIFLYSSALVFIPYFFESADKSDYIGHTYQTVMRKRYHQLFFRQIDSAGKAISGQIEKMFTMLTNSYVGNNLVVCEFSCCYFKITSLD